MLLASDSKGKFYEERGGLYYSDIEISMNNCTKIKSGNNYIVAFTDKAMGKGQAYITCANDSAKDK